MFSGDNLVRYSLPGITLISQFLLADIALLFRQPWIRSARFCKDYSTYVERSWAMHKL